MNLETLEHANYLKQKIELFEKELSSLQRQLSSCEHYLEDWGFESDGKTRQKHFQSQISHIKMPNRGNGEEIFYLRGDDPDAFRFYSKMIPEMIKIFTLKIKIKKAEIQDFKNELESL